MAGLAHWDDPDAPWDRLTLGDHVMPGVWEITGGECARQVDHKKTKDKDGARIRDLGLIPPRMAARGRLTSREDWDELQKIMPDIHPKKKGGIKFPLAIFHPAVALLGVSQIYVERIRPPEIKDGVLEIQIDMIDFGDPKETKVSKKPAVPSGYIGTDEDNAILAAQNRNWGLRRAGITLTDQFANTTASGPQSNFDKASDAEFAKLTGEDTRHPPHENVVGSIDPSTQPL
jgi:hypothetical protein